MASNNWSNWINPDGSSGGFGEYSSPSQSPVNVKRSSLSPSSTKPLGDNSGYFTGVVPYTTQKESGMGYEWGSPSNSSRGRSGDTSRSGSRGVTPQMSVTRDFATRAKPGAAPKIDQGAIDRRTEVEMGAGKRKLGEATRRELLTARRSPNKNVASSRMRDVLQGYGGGLGELRLGALKTAEMIQQPIFQARQLEHERDWQDYESSKFRVSTSTPSTDAGVDDLMRRFKRLGGRYA